MEDTKFDDLTKKMAAPLSRRSALKAALAATVGGLLAAKEITSAGAQTRSLSGTCSATTPCPAGYGCCTVPNNPSASRCIQCSGTVGYYVDQNGIYGCHCCNGTLCTNTNGGQTCVTGCPAGTTFNCQTGKCVSSCPSGQVFCGGACVSTTCSNGLTFNQASCSCACNGVACATGATCVNNTCVRVCPIGAACSTTNPACICGEANINGTFYPVCDLATLACVHQQCSTTAQCPSGTVCDYDNFCPAGQCVPTC